MRFNRVAVRLEFPRNYDQAIIGLSSDEERQLFDYSAMEGTFGGSRDVLNSTLRGLGKLSGWHEANGLLFPHSPSLRRLKDDAVDKFPIHFSGNIVVSFNDLMAACHPGGLIEGRDFSAPLEASLNGSSGDYVPCVQSSVVVSTACDNSFNVVGFTWGYKPRMLASTLGLPVESQVS